MKTFWHKLAATIMLSSVGFPLLFWGITLWRDATNTYCNGECASGWYAVISTLLALPGLITGIIIWAAASIKYNNRSEKN